MKDLKAMAILALEFIICLVIGLALDIDATAFAIITIVVMFVTCFVYYDVHKKNTSEHIRFDAKNNTAILLQRSKVSAAELRCDEVHYYNYQHHDAEIVYTGASAGGIHMGGFHTNKAYTSMSSAGKSGKAYISAEYNGEWITIEKIKLTPELLEEAKRDPRMKKFIVRDCIIAKHRGKEKELTSLERDKILYALEKNDTVMRCQTTERARIASYLPKDDIKYIINWVSGQ